MIKFLLLILALIFGLILGETSSVLAVNSYDLNQLLTQNSCVHFFWSSCDFSGADLQSKNLARVNLSGANLSNAN
ncbi:MAG: pentapeptide repeat-containing protein, partial [Microcoleaceae cyanobacterium]